MQNSLSSSACSRRRFLRGTALAGVGLLALPTALAACGGDDQAATGESGAVPVDFQLGWIKSMQFAGSFMAVERGYYNDVGLQVNLLGGGPSVDAITVVASGEALVGLADSNEIAVARGQGVPVVALAAAFQKSPFAMISLADSPIRTLEDQIGKTVAVSDSSRPTVQALMERKGLDPTKVNFVPKNPDPSVLADRQVDAYWGFVTSEAATLQARGVAIDFVLLADLGEKTYANSYFTTNEALASNRDAVTKLLAADLSGWQYAVDHNAEAAKIINERYQDEDEDLAVNVAQGEAQIPLLTASGELLAIDSAVFQANIKSAVDAGLIDKPYDAAEVVDTTVFADAKSNAPV